MVTTDVWMTWAARPDELPPPAGLLRRETAGVGRLGHSEDEGITDADLIEPATPEMLDPDGLRAYDGAVADSNADVDRERMMPGERTSSSERTSSGARRPRFRPAARLLSFLAAGGVAACGLVAVPGCQTFGPIAVHAAITACIELVKSLFDAPVAQLPQEFRPCDNFTWVVQGYELKFCLFCNPAVPNETYVQFQCEGKYYPLRMRRIERVEQPATVTGISIESITCEERFLADVESTVAPFMSGLNCAMRMPNARMLPSIAHYGTLDVRIDGAPAPRDGDFPVEGGALIELDGSFDEVTHYAMTCGIVELSFKSGQDVWNVHANPDVSAIAVFRNGELHDARFIFAPMPAIGTGL